MLALGVLVSGSGTNLQAILDAVAERRLDATIPVVISNRAGVRALERAASAKVPTRTIDHRGFPTRAAFDGALVEALRQAGVDTVALAGFDRLITRVLLDAFPQRVLNIHPALLPAFPGLHAQRQAWDHGVTISGATVHFVDEQTDHGPILLQGAVALHPDDSPEDVQQRILTVEHDLYPRALQLLAENRVRVEGRRVHIANAPAPPPPLVPQLR